MTMHRALFATLMWLAALATHAANVTELPGAKDSPLISRYAVSVLNKAADEPYAAVRVPAGPGRLTSSGELQFEQAQNIEGHISAYFYVAPKDKSALEVFRNYEAALQTQG